MNNLMATATVVMVIPADLAGDVPVNSQAQKAAACTPTRTQAFLWIVDNYSENLAKLNMKVKRCTMQMSKLYATEMDNADYQM